jgi:hypothetical protein
MGLQDLVNLLWTDVTMVVEGIKVFIEGLLATGAKIALDSTSCLAMFMSFQVSTQRTFHRLSKVDITLLLYLTHSNVTHNPIIQQGDILLVRFLASDPDPQSALASKRQLDDSFKREFTVPRHILAS